MNRRRRLLAALGATALAAPLGGFAQEFPSRPLRLIVPFPPGGSNDMMARLIASPLSAALGRNVVVDNRGGGNTIIGTEACARAPADGHTLLITGFPYISNPSLVAKLPYDTLRDFAAVGRCSTDPFLISVHPSLPAHTLADLVALARARPGALQYGHTGVGTGQHVAGELFKLAAGIDIVHVPFQGGAPAATAVLGGHAQVLVSTPATVESHVAAGRLRPLAVTSSERIVQMKDVPTFAESGYPGVVLATQVGVVVPAATPRPVIRRLGDELARAMKLPEVIAGMVRQGFQPAPLAADAFDALIRTEMVRMQAIVKDVKLRLD